MRQFCPSCEAEVEVGADLRCPTCHKAVQVLAQPTEAPARRSALPWVAGALAVGAAVVGGLYVRTGPAHAGATVAQVAAGDWQAQWRKSGLTEARAGLPGTPDAALTQAAKAAASVDALLKAQVGQGKLAPIDARKRRQHPVLDTAALWASVQQGKALPVHSIEVAWLAWAALQARGETGEFVIEGAGVTSPLLLTRTRVGIRTAGGVVVEPLAPSAMQKPTPVPAARVAAWWLLLRAQAERVANHLPASNEDLKTAEAVAPGEPSVLFGRCVAELDQGLFDLGVAKCEQALAKQDDPLARLLLAEVAMGMEQPMKASQRVDEALKVAPGLAEAMVLKGLLTAQRIAQVPEAMKAGVKAEARKWLNDALTADPKVARARATLAKLMLLDKDAAGAEALLHKAVDDFKDIESAVVLSDLLRSQKKNAEAVSMLEGIGGKLDDDAYVLALVSAHMGAGTPDKALEVAEAAHKAVPGSRQIAMLRAELLQQSGKVKDAIEALEPLKTGPEGDKVTLLQAQLYLADRQAAKAVALLEPIVARGGKEREPPALLMAAYALGGQKDKALAAARKLVADKLLPAGETAALLLQARDPETAQTLLEEAVQQAPDDDVVQTLAMMYVASQHKEKAEALRDRMAKLPDGKGKKWAELVDKAIVAAEAEMVRMRQGLPPTELAP